MTDIRISDPFLRRMTYALVTMTAVSLGFYTFGLLKESLAFLLNAVAPFLAAFLLAYILAPVVIGLQRRLKLGRIMGTLVLYLLIFLGIFLFLAVLIPALITKSIELFESLKGSIPVLLDRISQWGVMDESLVRDLQNRLEAIEIDYEKIVGTVLPALRRIASGSFEAMGQATRSVLGGVGSLVAFFSFLVFVGIIGFYFIVDWEKIGPTIRKMVPRERRDRMFDVLSKIDAAVGGFLRGQLTVALIVGLLFAAGLTGLGFLGFPALRNYGILIGAAAGLGGFIPYLGAVVGVSPALLIVLFSPGVPWTVRLVALMGVLALFCAIQAIEGFVLQPRIVGKGAGLHPLAIMLALVLGAQLGMGGLILAIPAACILRVLIREFYWLPIEGREADTRQKPDATGSPGV
jgi:predicted PurR-regulated permease PerM